MNNDVYFKCHSYGIGNGSHREGSGHAGKMHTRLSLPRHVHHPYCPQKTFLNRDCIQWKSNHGGTSISTIKADIRTLIDKAKYSEALALLDNLKSEYERLPMPGSLGVFGELDKDFLKMVYAMIPTDKSFILCSMIFRALGCYEEAVNLNFPSQGEIGVRVYITKLLSYQEYFDHAYSDPSNIGRDCLNKAEKMASIAIRVADEGLCAYENNFLLTKLRLFFLHKKIHCEIAIKEKDLNGVGGWGDECSTKDVSIKNYLGPCKDIITGLEILCVRVSNGVPALYLEEEKRMAVGGLYSAIAHVHKTIGYLFKICRVYRSDLDHFSEANEKFELAQELRRGNKRSENTAIKGLTAVLKKLAE